MIDYFDALSAWRKLILETTSELEERQLNQIPAGRSNNIIWNMGHLVTVSENILYKHVLAQRPQHGFELSQFAKGTRPEQFIDENQILLIRNALRETFPAFKMEHGSLVISEERLQFLMLHEHLHYQAIVALIRQLTTK